MPDEFKKAADKLFARKAITEREYVDLCVLATKLVDEHWDNRQGFAYNIAGMLAYPAVQENPLLGEIGRQFGELELPNPHVADSEDGVREKWQQVKNLVIEADKKF